MDALIRDDEDCSLNNHFDQPFVIPHIPDDIFDENIPTPEIFFFHPKTLASAALVAGFTACLIELIRATNAEIDVSLSMHNPRAEYYAIATASAVELACIKLSCHKYSFFFGCRYFREKRDGKY